MAVDDRSLADVFSVASTQVLNVIDHLGLKTTGDLYRCGEKKLLLTRNFGLSCLREVDRILAAEGLPRLREWGKDSPQKPPMHHKAPKIDPWVPTDVGALHAKGYTARALIEATGRSYAYITRAIEMRELVQPRLWSVLSERQKKAILAIFREVLAKDKMRQVFPEDPYAVRRILIEEERGKPVSNTAVRRLAEAIKVQAYALPLLSPEEVKEKLEAMRVVEDPWNVPGLLDTLAKGVSCKEVAKRTGKSMAEISRAVRGKRKIRHGQPIWKLLAEDEKKHIMALFQALVARHQEQKDIARTFDVQLVTLQKGIDGKHLSNSALFKMAQILGVEPREMVRTPVEHVFTRFPEPISYAPKVHPAHLPPEQVAHILAILADKRVNKVAMAKASRLNLSTLYNIVGGSRYPGKEMAQRIADALGKPVEEVLNGTVDIATCNCLRDTKKPLRVRIIPIYVRLANQEHLRLLRFLNHKGIPVANFVHEAVIRALEDGERLEAASTDAPSPSEEPAPETPAHLQ